MELLIPQLPALIAIAMTAYLNHRDRFHTKNAVAESEKNDLQAKINAATQEGVKALLRDRLISAMHKAKQQGYIYIHQLENIDKMYTEYKNLGGNGTIVHMMKEVSKLPTKTDLN